MHHACAAAAAAAKTQPLAGNHSCYKLACLVLLQPRKLPASAVTCDYLGLSYLLPWLLLYALGLLFTLAPPT
jgi:hypothetical protein